MTLLSFHASCDAFFAKIADRISAHWQRETGLSRIYLALWLSRALLISDVGFSFLEGSETTLALMNVVFFEIGLHSTYRIILKWEEEQEDSDQMAVHPKMEGLKWTRHLFLLLFYVCFSTLLFVLPFALLEGDKPSGKLLILSFFHFPLYIVTSPFIPRGKRISSLAPASMEIAHESSHS